MTKKVYYLDKFLLFSVIVLYLVSITAIKSAEAYLSPSLGDLVLKQSIWYLVGFLLILLIVKLDNKFFYKYAWVIYIINNLLLLGLLFLAPEINGSKCWYVISGIGSFQPSEFMKISLILVYSKILSDFNRKRKITLKRELILLGKIFIVLLIPSILTFLEPDTGSVIIYLVITFAMLFVSKIRLRWFLVGGGLLVSCLALFLGLYFFYDELFISIFGSSFFYRMDRLISWKTGSGMQLENSLVAIATSSITGHGFNRTPLYFPESGTDFIFSVFASNFGLLGSIVLIIFFTVLNIYILNITNERINNRDRFLIVGIIGIIFFQQLQNISMTIGLLPITGITLPFISYGGSSLLSYMILIAFVLNITKKKKVIRR